MGRAGAAESGGVIASAACAPPPAPPPPPAPYAAPPPPAPPPPAAPPAPPTPRDACGALPLQYLIGRPRTEIPVPVYPERRRVVCSTCQVTQEFVESRLTIVYDSETGVVKSVRCG